MKPQDVRQTGHDWFADHAHGPGSAFFSRTNAVVSLSGLVDLTPSDFVKSAEMYPTQEPASMAATSYLLPAAVSRVDGRGVSHRETSLAL